MRRCSMVLALASALACGPKGEVPTAIPPAGPSAPWALDEEDEDEDVDAPRQSQGPLDGFDEEVAAIMQAHDVPGLGLAIIKDGKTVLARGYGLREQGKPEPIDADTTFAIASNTKAFLATAVGLLVADGKLGWDDRVVQHLPGLQLWDDYTTRHIRVRDLLCHRSGLDRWAGDAMWIGSKLDTAGVMKRLRHVPADHDLREAYGYSNLMFVVAGEVIRAKTGQSWDAFLAERVLTPLKMERTTSSVDALKTQDNVATPHALVPGGQQIVPYLDVDNAGPAGALNSSVADMTHWMQMQLDAGTWEGQRVVPESVIGETRRPHTPIERRTPSDTEKTGDFLAYGLGWVLMDVHGQLHVTHSGGLPGMTSRVLLVPDAKLGIVALTNSESGAATHVARIAAARLLGHDRRDLLKAATEKKPESPTPKPAEGAKPAAPKSFAGRFANPILGAAVVTLNGDVLHLDLPDHGGLTCDLVYREGSTFDCAWTDATMGISTVTYDVAGGRAKSLRFKIRPEFIDPLEYRFSRR